MSPEKIRMSPENQWLVQMYTEIVPFFGDMLVFRGVSLFVLLRLMVQKSCVHQLRLVGSFFPMIYDRFSYESQVGFSPDF